MQQYLEKFTNLRDEEKKQVLAAAQWGDGPFTRKIFNIHFPKIDPNDVPALIAHFKALKA